MTDRGNINGTDQIVDGGGKRLGYGRGVTRRLLENTETTGRATVPGDGFRQTPDERPTAVFGFGRGRPPRSSTSEFGAPPGVLSTVAAPSFGRGGLAFAENPPRSVPFIPFGLGLAATSKPSAHTGSRPFGFTGSRPSFGAGFDSHSARFAGSGGRSAGARSFDGGGGTRPVAVQRPSTVGLDKLGTVVVRLTDDTFLSDDDDEPTSTQPSASLRKPPVTSQRAVGNGSGFANGSSRSGESSWTEWGSSSVYTPDRSAISNSRDSPAWIEPRADAPTRSDEETARIAAEDEEAELLSVRRHLAQASESIVMASQFNKNKARNLDRAEDRGNTMFGDNFRTAFGDDDFPAQVPARPSSSNPRFQSREYQHRQGRGRGETGHQTVGARDIVWGWTNDSDEEGDGVLDPQPAIVTERTRSVRGKSKRNRKYWQHARRPDDAMGQKMQDEMKKEAEELERTYLDEKEPEEWKPLAMKKVEEDRLSQAEIDMYERHFERFEDVHRRNALADQQMEMAEAEELKRTEGVKNRPTEVGKWFIFGNEPEKVRVSSEATSSSKSSLEDEERRALMQHQELEYVHSLTADRDREKRLKDEKTLMREKQSKEEEGKRVRAARILTAAEGLPAEPSAGTAGSIALRVRFPDGTFEIRRFLESDPLALLLQYVESKGFILDEYSVFTSDLPRQNVTAMDKTKSFVDLSWPKACVVFVESSRA